VSFFGSQGLVCYKWDGDVAWKNDLGLLDAGWFRSSDAQWGFGSSPLIHEGRVIVQCDVQEGSFIAAYDVATGEELWKTYREEYPTWSSPTIYTSPRGTAIVVNGYKHTGGYDFATGNPIWWLSGGGDIPVPTPVVSDDLIFLTSAHGPEQPILALRTSAKGALSETSVESIAWNHRSGALICKRRLYTANTSTAVKTAEYSPALTFRRANDCIENGCCQAEDSPRHPLEGTANFISRASPAKSSSSKQDQISKSSL
jgi:outer membrane protein assembly factor BamB